MSADTLPVCYRHADRETRLSCSNCGRPICVECMTAAPVGQRCPDCAAPATQVVGRDRLYGRAGAPVTYGLIALCVAVYLLASVAPQIEVYGAQINPLVLQGEWWRLVTAAFLHGGLTHILFNMYALYVFGPQIERQVGSVPFAALYLGSAVAGGAAYLAYDLLVGDGLGIAVGASGAIFGLFGATLAAAYRNRDTLAGRAGLRQLLTLLAINFALPLLLPIIAWQAHLGGLVAGFVIATAWAALGRRRGGAVARTAVAVAVAGMAVLAVALV